MARRDDSKVYGVNACRALFLRRARDITRVYLREDRIDAFRDLLAMCARLHVPYRVVPDADLGAVTESRHHEGICIVARGRGTVPLEDILRAPGAACVLGIAGVGNPHNVGAILRTAAHFGVRGVVFLGADAPDQATTPDERDGPAVAAPRRDADDSDDRGAPGGDSVEGPRAFRLPPSAARTAQGAAEWMDVAAEPEPHRALRAARAAGFTVAATSSRGGHALYAAPLPPRLLLLIGAEDDGLPAEALAAADLVIAIPGTGHVESLNVAAATAVVLGECWRQREAGRSGGEAKRRDQADRPRGTRR